MNITGINTTGTTNTYCDKIVVVPQNTNANFVLSGAYKSTYVILGEEVAINGYKDIQLASCIEQINILGKPYYDELIKQGIKFSDEIEKILSRKFIEFERDRKIDLVSKKD